VLLYHNEVFEFQIVFHQNLIDLSPVFGSQCLISAENPNELVMIQIEFGATPNYAVVFIVGIQNPITLFGKEWYWLDFQLGGAFFINSIGNQIVFSSIERPRSVPHYVVISINSVGDISFDASAFGRFVRIVIPFYLVPCSEILFDVESLLYVGRWTTGKDRGKETAQQNENL